MCGFRGFACPRNEMSTNINVITMKYQLSYTQNLIFWYHTIYVWMESKRWTLEGRLLLYNNYVTHGSNVGKRHKSTDIIRRPKMCLIRCNVIVFRTEKTYYKMYMSWPLIRINVRLMYYWELRQIVKNAYKYVIGYAPQYS